MSQRMLLPDAARISGVVAVLRADDAAQYLPVCRALVDGGVTALEVTLTTPGTLDALPLLRQELPEASIGVGTVLDLDQLRAAVDNGAEFLVTPVADVRLVSAAVTEGVPIIPGALTPTEVNQVWAAGAAAVKIFPAAAVGPGYLSQLGGPFPDLAVMPSGGVGIGDIPAWIGAGAVAVSLGGPLLGDAFRGGDLEALRRRAAGAVAAVRSARGL